MGATLVLDMATIAKIYMNQITKWSDPAFAAFNSPQVLALLPDEDIIVVGVTTDNDATELLSMALSAASYEFADQVTSHHPSSPSLPLRITVCTCVTTHHLLAQVGVGPTVQFPVQSAPGRWVGVASSSDYTQVLVNTNNSLGFWISNEVYQVPTKVV
jgi:ABC-type phosphate transport system substrate-binding protein